jgi:sec-independent protein translocase protein TatA
MFDNIGIGEILLIMVFVIVFFGAKKIPEIAKGLGSGIREFRKAARDIQEDVQNSAKEIDDKDVKQQQPPPQP